MTRKEARALQVKTVSLCVVAVNRNACDHNAYSAAEFKDVARGVESFARAAMLVSQLGLDDLADESEEQ